jgi:hypothetical protein
MAKERAEELVENCRMLLEMLREAAKSKQKYVAQRPESTL